VVTSSEDREFFPLPETRRTENGSARTISRSRNLIGDGFREKERHRSAVRLHGAGAGRRQSLPYFLEQAPKVRSWWWPPACWWQSARSF